MRGVAAGAANEHAIGYNAIIAPRQNCPVVGDKTVSDSAQPPHGFRVADHQRFAAGIGAGHDQQQRLWLCQPSRSSSATNRFVEQQIVQRRVRQHDAKMGQAWRDAGQASVAIRALAHQYDGSLRRFQRLPFNIIAFHPACQRGDVGRHDRERLGIALLALAQAGHGGGVLGVADQVKTAQTLDGQNLAGEQTSQRSGDDIIHFDHFTSGVE